MLKIWGRTNSVNVKKALWCVEELGVKYERVDAGMQFGVTRTPEYMKMNPNSLVPQGVFGISLPSATAPRFTNSLYTAATFFTQIRITEPPSSGSLSVSACHCR